MIFYLVIGLTIGFYIATSLVMPLIQEAREDDIDNAITRNPVLTVVLNIAFTTIIWPVFIPYFFSERFRKSLKNGFIQVVNTDN